MSDRAKVEVSAVAAALALGILGDALLRSFPWGANLALWVGVLTGVTILLGRSRSEALGGTDTGCSCRSRLFPWLSCGTTRQL